MQDQEQIKMEPILCQRHRKNPIFCIAYLKDHAKFVCEECLFQIQQEKPQFSLGLLIYIKKAMEDPVYVINSLREHQNKNENFDVFQEQINALLEQLQEVKKEFTNNYLKIKLNAKNLFKLTEEMPQNKAFQEIIMQLEGCKNNFDAFNQIEKKLFEFLQEQKNKKDYVKQFQKNYEETLVNTNLGTQQYKKLQSMITDLVKSQTKLQINALCQFSVNSPSNICPPQYFKFLFAEKFYNCRYERILCQEKSQLSWNTLCQKVQNKSNLLFIFRSWSNCVFGGFTPCVINVNAQQVQDCSFKSFIFSVTNQKIFEINKKNPLDAFEMNQSLKFSSDLVIQKNFTDGSSALGTNYLNNSQKQYPNDYLFGQPTPQLIEFEIFQISEN